MNPRISVVIPLFNKQRYIRRAVESVLSQDYPCYEVLVVDDGSTDDSAAIVSQIEDPKVRLIRQPNVGVSGARNRGIEEACGSYVAFLDADDYYLPGFLGVIAAMIAEFPSAGMYSTALQLVFPDGRQEVVKNRILDKYDKPFLVDDPFSAWCLSNFISIDCVCVRRDLILDHGYRFPVGESVGEDHDFMFQILSRHRMAHTRGAYACHSVMVEGGLTWQMEAPVRLLEAYTRLAERVESGKVLPELKAGACKLVSSYYLNTARHRMRDGDLSGARQLLSTRRAFRHWTYWCRTALKLLSLDIISRFT